MSGCVVEREGVGYGEGEEGRIDVADVAGVAGVTGGIQEEDDHGVSEWMVVLAPVDGTEGEEEEVAAEGVPIDSQTDAEPPAPASWCNMDEANAGLFLLLFIPIASDCVGGEDQAKGVVPTLPLDGPGTGFCCCCWWW